MKLRKSKMQQLLKAICLVFVLAMVVAPSAEAKTKVKLNKKTVTLNVGETVNLKVKGKNKKSKVKWSTSNKKVATVSSKGKVTAKKAGKATITAKMNKKKFKCKVKVKADKTDNKDKNQENIQNTSVGRTQKYTINKAAAKFADSMVGYTWKDYRPTDDHYSDVAIYGHWCAAFIRFVYDDDDSSRNSIRTLMEYVESNPNDFEVAKINSRGRDGYEPQIGDLVLYDEDHNYDENNEMICCVEYDEDLNEYPQDCPVDYEHIGIVVDKRFDEASQQWQFETVEGNYFEIKPDCDIYEYHDEGLKHPYDTRCVGRVAFDQVRYGMIKKYIRPKNQEKKYTIGDINGDNEVDIRDCVLITNVYLSQRAKQLGWFDYRPNGLIPAEVYYRGDINQDGTVDMRDRSEIVNYLLRK